MLWYDIVCFSIDYNVFLMKDFVFIVFLFLKCMVIIKEEKIFIRKMCYDDNFSVIVREYFL